MSTPPASYQPNLIRQNLRRARKRLTHFKQKRSATQLAQRISKHSAFKQSKKIATYLAISGEISLGPLIKLAMRQGKQVFIPVIDGKALIFCRYNPWQKMRLNRFGIQEIADKKATRLTSLDIIFCPLVAFDSHCHRIGMGGGFYDRTLMASKRKDSPLLLGVAHELQKIQRIYPEKWDVALDGVFTPKRFF